MIAVLKTHIGQDLFIRSNPTEEEVKGFIKVHNARYHSGELDEAGEAAFLIRTAFFFDDEDEVNSQDLSKAQKEIDITGVIGDGLS